MGSIIKEKIKKIKGAVVNFLTDTFVFVVLVVLLSSAVSFILGQLYVQEKIARQNYEEVVLDSSAEDDGKSIKLVASKNGKTFYLPWCGGGLRIKKQNRIYFYSKEDAKKAGYRPAKNCEGL